MRKTLLTSLMTFGIVTITLAQSKTGSISGTITTTDGKPAADVSVILKNTSRGAISASDGSYAIRRIPAGNYVAEISLIGFATVTNNVKVEAGQNEVLDLRLSISASELNEVTVRSGRSRYVVRDPSPSLRVQTPLQLIPQNIQVITENVLSDQQIFDMSESVTRNVSGASSSVGEAWGNYANLMMRGGTVTAFRNGMNVKLPWGPLLEDMSLVDRIEFVKGPAGFMLANGEPTGLYNIVTKKPTGVTRGQIGFATGSYDNYRTTLDLDGKLSDDGKFLYRFNLMGQLKNSPRQFDFNNRYAVAPVITYRFNDKTSVTAEYTFQHMKMAMLGAAYLFSPKMGDLPADFSLLDANLQPTYINDHSLFVTLNHELSARWRLTTQFSYLNYQQTGSSIWPAFRGLKQNGELLRSVTNWDASSEARLGQAYVNGEWETGPLTHKILGGVDMTYKDYAADFYQSDTLSGHDMFGSPVTFNIYNPVHGLIPPPDLPVFDRTLPLSQRSYGRMGESSTSLYLQDEIGLMSDRLRITIAGRYTNINQSSFLEYSKDDKFIPRVGISFSIDKSASVYALYDRSFVAQQGKDSSSRPFVPVTGNNVEAGIKKDWMGGLWTSSFSIYRITRNNVVTYVPGPEYKPVQTGQTKTRGVELDLRGELNRNFSLILNYAFTEGEITKDEDESKIGADLPGTGFPKHTSNAWLSYKVADGEMKGFGASLGYQYQGARQYDLPEYFRLDGGVYWQGKDMRISLNANNILDDYLYAGAPYEFGDSPENAGYYFQVEPGVNFKLGIAYRF